MGRTLVLDRERCLACRSCELACAVAHSRSGRLADAVAEDPRPRRRVKVVRTDAGTDAFRCQQCGEPLCVFSCKTGALHRAPDDWATVLDQSRCVGCLMCLMVCPFGIRPDPANDRIDRCDVCRGMATPACVTACPTHALAVGDTRHATATTDFSGHVVIVGSSAAGMAAAEAAREHAPACAITLVTADDAPEYSRPLLAYALAGQIGPEELNWRPAGYLESQLGAKVLTGVRAVGLDAAAHTVSLSDGRAVGFDRLIIASGARAMRVAVPGADRPGVSVLRDLSDLEHLAHMARAGVRAVVVGAGNVGLQVAEAFMARGAQVTLVVRSPHVLSQMVDAAVGRRVGELFVARGLTLRTGCDLAEIGGNGRVESVRLDAGDRLPADVVVIAKGIESAIGWVRDSGILARRGIVVDLSGRTDLPDVFAAGDCAEVIDPLTGAHAVSGVWPVAYEMGRAAGSTAVGVEQATRGALRMNASRFFGVSIISIGEVRADRLPGARAEVLADRQDVYRKLVRVNGRLAGALLYGDVSDAGLYYRLYREGIEIGDVDPREQDGRYAEGLVMTCRKS